MKKAFISIGSNLGNRLENLKQALKMLSAEDDITLQAVSAVYETAPVGGPEQGPYLNACAALLTVLSPTKLLFRMQTIENSMGRVRKEKWGPRIIDLDMLVYEGVTMKSPLLELPHPLITGRDFVLIPLADIAPELLIPGRKETVCAILLKRKQPKDIAIFVQPSWHSG